MSWTRIHVLISPEYSTLIRIVADYCFKIYDIVWHKILEIYFRIVQLSSKRSKAIINT